MAPALGGSRLKLVPHAATDTDWDGRIAALDGLRAGAMLLGVCFHASVSYMTGKMPGLLWLVRDRAGHCFFDLLFWWLHAFRLPLFFFLAGFFAAFVESRHGPWGLLAQRARRLLVPFLAGCVLILPITFYVWTAGWLVSGHCTIRQILAIKFRGQIRGELFGPLHLWFLEDLFLLISIFCVYRWLWHIGLSFRAKHCARNDKPICARLRFRLVSLATARKKEIPLWLAMPTMLVLAFNPQLFISHHNSFLPSGWRLLYYGLFFAAGAALYPWRKHLREICCGWGFSLALCVPLTGLLLPLIQQLLEQPGEWQTRWVLAATLSLLAWLSLFGLLGLALRYGTGHRPRLHYLADASYWVYLCHLPLVALIQLDLDGAVLPAGLKFIGVVSLTILLALASYHTLVRYTFLGACLHGWRHRPPLTSRKRKRRTFDPSLTLPARLGTTRYCRG